VSSRNNQVLAALQSRFTVTGDIFKMELDGTIVGKFGKAGKKAGEFSTIHELDCHSENELYSAEITSWRVQKIQLHPNAKATGAK